MTNDRRKMLLKVLAVFFLLRGLTNTFKFLTSGGLVFFGAMLDGIDNLILSQAFGIFLALYAYGMWQRRRFALPMGIAYLVFVVFNVLLFPMVHGLGDVGTGRYAVFGLVAIGANVLALWLLREEQAMGGLS